MPLPDIAGINEGLYSLEAEQSVLGAILLDSSCLTTVMETIHEDYFYREQHRAIFSAFMRMFSKGTPIDAVTVLDELSGDKAFPGQTEAKVYLVSLMQQVPSTSSVDYYCKIVEDKYLKRALITASGEIIKDASDDAADASVMIDAAEQKIFDIRKGRDISGLTPIADSIVAAYDNLALMSGPDREKYQGMKTGITLLDSITSGLNKSDLIILAARPGIGKSSFAMNIATNVARRYDTQVAVFSLEMSKEQLALRVLSSESLVESGKLRSGMLTPDDWSMLVKAADQLSKMQIFIDDTANITVMQMKAKLRRMKNLGLVVIDYLQLMSSGRRIENRVNEVSEITRGIKIMAKELNVPVILLSQLSRSSEQRKDDHRPMLSDLRESGSIEQDADLVWFLYRDHIYHPETSPAEAECIVAKNRHGETTTVHMRWDGEHTRFMNAELNRDEG